MESEAHQLWRKENKDKIRGWVYNWRKNNREKYLASRRKYATDEERKAAHELRYPPKVTKTKAAKKVLLVRKPKPELVSLEQLKATGLSMADFL